MSRISYWSMSTLFELNFNQQLQLFPEDRFIYKKNNVVHGDLVIHTILVV